MNTYSKLSFRSAAVSREESAVLLAEADSSPIDRLGMATIRNVFQLHDYREAAHLYPSPELCYNPNIERTIPLSESSFSPNIGIQSAPRFPAPAYEQQDSIFSEAFEILKTAIAQHAFPAASIAVTSHGKLVALKAFGRFNYEPDSPQVTAAGVFDLASVSKAVATTSMAMILYRVVYSIWKRQSPRSSPSSPNLNPAGDREEFREFSRR